MLQNKFMKSKSTPFSCIKSSQCEDMYTFNEKLLLSHMQCLQCINEFTTPQLSRFYESCQCAKMYTFNELLLHIYAISISASASSQPHNCSKFYESCQCAKLYTFNELSLHIYAISISASASSQPHNCSKFYESCQCAKVYTFNELLLHIYAISISASASSQPHNCSKFYESCKCAKMYTFNELLLHIYAISISASSSSQPHKGSKFYESCQCAKMYTFNELLLHIYAISISASASSQPHNCSKFYESCQCAKMYTFNELLLHIYAISIRWMDGWVRVLRPFNSISVISRRWKGEHERPCAMKRRLGSGRISPPVGFEPVTPWSEVVSANRSATRTLRNFYQCSQPHNCSKFYESCQCAKMYTFHELLFHIYALSISASASSQPHKGSKFDELFHEKNGIILSIANKTVVDLWFITVPLQPSLFSFVGKLYRGILGTTAVFYPFNRVNIRWHDSQQDNGEELLSLHNSYFCFNLTASFSSNIINCFY